MSDQRNGGIAWTEQTWNPLRGCSRVSAGCVNCYAESMAARFCGPGHPYEGTINTETKRWNGKVRLVPEKLTDPLRWTRPRRVFVNSMSDLFHEDVPDEFIDQVFAVMALAPQHTFQVLTKRPERMLEYFKSLHSPEAHARGWNVCAWAAEQLGMGGHEMQIAQTPKGLPNVWLGITVENQQAADQRIPLLLQTPAAVHWLSVEPMLGPINLRAVWCASSERGFLDATTGKANYPGQPSSARWIPDMSALDWVVCGGESGPNARPMHPDWARSLRDQCKAAGVPFLFKQWGEWSPQDPGETSHKDCAGVLPSGDCKLYSQGYVAPFDSSERLARAGNVRLDGRTLMFNVGKKRAGRLFDGVLHDEYPV